MEFSVKFISKKGDSTFSVIGWHWQRDIGIEGVKKIRESLKLPKLPLDLIKNKSEGIGSKSSVELSISEEAIYENEIEQHFASSNTFVINVPKNFLDKYLIEKVVGRTRDDGQVTVAWIELEINKEAIMGDWIAAGCPQEWGFEEDEQSA